MINAKRCRRGILPFHCEALMCVFDDKLGFVPPDDFEAFLEKFNLAREVNEIRTQ